MIKYIIRNIVFIGKKYFFNLARIEKVVLCNKTLLKYFSRANFHYSQSLGFMKISDL